MTQEELLQKIKQAKEENFTHLSLDENQLSELPKEISELTNLIYLSLDENQLSELPKEISELTNLTTLNLYNNQLSELPKEISELTNLTTLNLDSNELSELPKEISELTGLQELNLDGNQLSELPKEISNMTNLTTLSLVGNQLSELPKEMSNMTGLQELHLAVNNFITFPEAIIRLPNLKWVDLDHNQLSELPREICELTNLEKLWLENNELIKIPTEIMKLKRLSQLDLRRNPDLKIPTDIFSDFSDVQKILDYLRKADQPLNEAKIVVIGEPSVGKSCLIERLIHGTFELGKNSTHGVEIHPWEDVDVNDQKVKLNIWDFGGQELMHSTHQFFFTKRTLYILVVNARENDNEKKADYWLRKIESLSEKSPVIVVGNKLDECKKENGEWKDFEIDEVYLASKFKNIKGFYGVSCNTEEKLFDEDFEKFENSLISEIGKLKEIHYPFPSSWVSMKKRLEGMEDDYISNDVYIRRCVEEGITEKVSQETLVEFLHDLGLVLSFRKDLRLNDTNVLNPRWVTKGVYALIESERVKDNDGVLTLELMGEILDSDTYPSEKHLFLIDMMRKFELLYDIKTDKEFLIPGSLPLKEVPTGNWEDSLQFQYDYEVYFSSIITRLMVKMNGSIVSGLQWRKGVVFEDRGNKALVKADIEEEKIYIDVIGTENTKRDFLSKIRGNFDEIHKAFESLEIQQLVPIPEHEGYFEDYDHLLNLEELGKETFVPRGLKIDTEVKLVLNGVESELAREQKRKEKDKDKLKRGYKEVETHKSEVERRKNVALAKQEVDNRLEIKAKEGEIKRLKEELNPLSQIKDFLDGKAEVWTTVIRWGLIITILVLLVGFIAECYIYVDWIIEKWSTIQIGLGIFAVIVVFIPLLWSLLKKNDKSLDNLIEDKVKNKLYIKNNFEITEYVDIKKLITEKENALVKIKENN